MVFEYQDMLVVLLVQARKSIDERNAAAITVHSDEITAAITLHSDEITAAITLYSDEITAAITLYSNEITADITLHSDEITADITLHSDEITADITLKPLIWLAGIVSAAIIIPNIHQHPFSTYFSLPVEAFTHLESFASKYKAEKGWLILNVDRSALSDGRSTTHSANSP